MKIYDISMEINEDMAVYKNNKDKRIRTIIEIILAQIGKIIWMNKVWLKKWMPKKKRF